MRPRENCLFGTTSRPGGGKKSLTKLSVTMSTRMCLQLGWFPEKVRIQRRELPPENMKNKRLK